MSDNTQSQKENDKDTKKIENIKTKVDLISKIIGWVIIGYVAFTHPESGQIISLMCGAGFMACPPVSPR